MCANVYGYVFVDKTYEEVHRMLPSILAKQPEKGIGDYIGTTFPMTNEPFKGSVRKMLKKQGFITRTIEALKTFQD